MSMFPANQFARQVVWGTTALSLIQNIAPAYAQNAAPVVIVGGSGASGGAAIIQPPTSSKPALDVFIDPGSINANGQATMANSAPVVLSSNQSVGDPCTFQAKNQTAISSALGSTQIVAGVAAKKIYVCSAIGIVSAALNLSFIEGTGSTCATATADLGSTGAAGGMPIAANGGFTFGGGAGTAFETQNASASLCFLQSSTSLVAGGFSYVQQ